MNTIIFFFFLQLLFIYVKTYIPSPCSDFSFPAFPHRSYFPELFCFNSTLLSTSTVKVTFFLEQCSQNTALQLKLYKCQFFQEYYFRGCCPKTAFCKIFPKAFLHLDRRLFTATPWVWYSVSFLVVLFVCFYFKQDAFYPRTIDLPKLYFPRMNTALAHWTLQGRNLLLKFCNNDF